MFAGKFAVEVEVGHDGTPTREDVAAQNFVWDGDGSIRDHNRAHSSEFQTKVPYPTTAAGIERFKKNIDALFTLIDPLTINSSMGTHVHVSFTNKKNYDKLMRYDFVKRFEDAAKPLIPPGRVCGKYSRFYHDAENFSDETLSQLSRFHKVDARYHSVNFNAYNIHKTVEFRVFPGARQKKIVEYTTWLLGFIDEYLRTAVVDEAPIKEEVEEAEEIFVDVSKNSREQLYESVLFARG